MPQTHHLEIKGILNLDQFWPRGSSDADTTKLLLTVDASSMRVRLAGEADFLNTQAFVDAGTYDGLDRASGKPKIKSVIKDSKITVRLQRIDAPELHYRPDARGSEGLLAGTGLIKEYRQHQAETAVVKLAEFLRSFGSNAVPCSFVTELKSSEGPGAAIDKYGRFVGDILLPDGTNLNLWLLKAGLAVVALYDSMLPHEIDESVDAWQAGLGARDGIAKYYNENFSRFNPKLLYRGKNAPLADEGRSRFMHPKFFRRQTTWWAFTQVNAFEGDFADWLTSKDEQCWYLPEFRAQGRRAPKYALYDRAADGNGISWEPQDFIFAESASSLQRLNGDGTLEKIKDW
jgi:endonuclease YncB( thermonuclease family)